MAEYVMYTKSGCPFCSKARSLLERERADYEEYDLTRNPDCYTELRLRLWQSGADPVPLTVPQIFRGTEYIGGSDRLEAYLSRSNRRR